MHDKPYDLQALLYELKAASAQGMVDAQDLTRITATVMDHLGCSTADEAWNRLYGDWKALPRGTVMSGLRAGQILSVLPMLRFHNPVVDQTELDELKNEAEAYGPGDQRRQALITALDSSAGLQRIDGPDDMERALRRLEQTRGAFPPGSPERDALDVQHAGLRAHLAQAGGGEDDFDSAVDDLARLRNSPVFDETNRLGIDAQVALFRAHQATRREDETALARHIQELDDVVRRLSPDHMDRLGMEANLDVARGNLEILRARRTGRLEDVTPGQDQRRAGVTPVEEVRRRIAALPPDAQADRYGEAGISRMGRAILARDAHGVTEALALIHDALDLLQPDDPRWIRAASTLGGGHVVLAGLAGVPRADRPHHLDQGISWLKHARRMAGGPAHPLWASTGLSLARAYRHRGDNQFLNARATRLNHAESRRVGLEAVRASAWTVLLQSGTAHAAGVGRRIGEEALEVAHWCVADGAYDEAVRALDAGRGLVLHSATVTDSVPEMLASLGQEELAAEWRASAAGPVDQVDPAGFGSSGPPSRLRRRVLDALAASPHRRRLLDVPTPDEIGRALTAMGRTALVYLAPGGEGGGGAALIVDARGTVTALDLPELRADAVALTAYHQVGAPGRDAGGPPETTPAPAAPQDRYRGGAELTRLCDWAGSAVMEPLLKAVPRGIGRAPSLVLVPMGELGVVPWHAARIGRRRACQAASISYVPSARLLCELAARRPAGVREALVVGNPTLDLYHAGEEAQAIHRVFHPHGTLLGPGTATPAAVTGWLSEKRGGMLHLACHGVLNQGDRHSSYLKLSGGELSAEQLTEGSARYRELELVVLAACRTHVSGHGYDEAYSLATAFLVAGARSVLGSLWTVPDGATSLLMYMTHHYMAREGRTPGEALREAQSWMLQDRRTRQAPPGMPADMAARVPELDADDLAAWAGFTHLGW
ncbi:CHAT domain-containing protein [Streptomyces sp. NRRL F-5727]|uniref:CHAT domain-containing protein n=1 Tax=Streptomyces sp. NRRL F-5727 TaxID=1463871 RepID=UPI0004C680EE|nr:CHAT domain-containing protein [Streptomyces sp. NRRL F-5727]